MTLARDEYIFLMILAANLIVSVIYLLAGILIAVPRLRRRTIRRSCTITGDPM